MATNEILPFCATDTGTNLLTQAEYDADSQRPIGNQPGVARSKLVNKVLKQSSLLAAALAQYLADKQATDITDDMTPSAIAALIDSVISASISVPDASTTVKGKVQLATNAEAQALSNALKAITPSALKAAFNAEGSAPLYACRAWVNFKGTGTVAIRASGNVSSITDNGEGDYTINFTTALPDANYCVSGSVQVGIGTTTPNGISGGANFSQNTSSFRFQTFQVGSGGIDAINVNVAIFR